MSIHLLEPFDGAIVRQLTQRQIDFIEDIQGPEIEEFDWANLKRKKDDWSEPLPVTFRWKSPGKAVLVLADSENFSDGKLDLNEINEGAIYPGELNADEGKAQVYNLLIGHTYYWYVRTEKETSKIRSFTVDPMPPRLIAAGGLSNVRDIGGQRTIEGRYIRQGLVYRGCEMEFHHTITEDGIHTLRNCLGIRTDLDVRFEAVGQIEKSALGEDINYALLPCKPYGEFLEDKKKAGEIFRLFTNRENYPFYIHCWGGADRTGTIILILCGILGVEDEALFEDYEFTSLSIWGYRSRKSELFMTLLDALNQYGGRNLSENCKYFLLDCGISEEEIEEIRAILLEETDTVV